MNKSHYELTFIIDGNIPENENAKISEQIKNYIQSNTGEITFSQEFGRKKLGYEIKGVSKGTYFVVEFEAEPDSIKIMEKDLKLDKNILRYIIVKKPRNIAQINPENVKTEFKSEEDRREMKNKERESSRMERKEIKIEKPKEIKKEEEEKEGSKIEVETKETEEVPTETKEKEAEKTTVEEGKSDKDDLDKKLDEILNKDEF